MKDFIQQMRAKTTLMLKTLGKGVQDVEITEIPKIWTSFPNKEDEWISVEFPETEDTTACIYKAKEGGDFPPHRHKYSYEQFTILNEGGSVEVVTDTYKKVFNFPASVAFNIGEPHYVKFLTDTKILVMWHPKMLKGWNAQFIEE